MAGLRGVFAGFGKSKAFAVGGEAHPAWSANLLARDERQEMWDAVASYWPAYDRYAVRAGDRAIRVFLLERVSR